MTNKIEEILRLCQENDVKLIDFKTVDLTGRWHHITIPVERFGEDTVQIRRASCRERVLRLV